MAESTRNDILAVGTELVSRNGYNATGLDAVLKGAGVPKGSFYHYFSSKEDFGLALIDQYAHEYDEKLRRLLTDTAAAPLDRIRSYLDAERAHLQDEQFVGGCLIGNLGQELSDQNERFRQRLSEVFWGWKSQFEACLREAQAQGAVAAGLDPVELAEFLLSGWEGAVLRAKVTRTTGPLDVFIRTFFRTVLSE